MSGTPPSWTGYQMMPPHRYSGDAGIHSTFNAPESLTLAPIHASPAHDPISTVGSLGGRGSTWKNETRTSSPVNLLAQMHERLPRPARTLRSSPTDGRQNSRDPNLSDNVSMTSLGDPTPQPLKASRKTRPAGRKNKMDAEVRKRVLEADKWACEVKPRSVQCRACDIVIQLERRNNYVYYSFNWDKHRLDCKVIWQLEGRAPAQPTRKPRSKKTTKAPRETTAEAVKDEMMDVESSSVNSWSDTSSFGTPMNTAAPSASVPGSRRIPQTWLSGPGIPPPQQYFGYSRESSMSVDGRGSNQPMLDRGTEYWPESLLWLREPSPSTASGSQKSPFSMRHELEHGSNSGKVAEHEAIDSDVVQAAGWLASFQSRSRSL
ncbi:hypothetical protein Hypma_004614 [Hypsizygus marmoreus]|uniref:Uncharacterized protein n=1 Tax=Hypsizygus marmoreus TaxID=39966 RepID=A0A369K0Z8_HYPMA|nr:hypothetical protein Hypma_004614 [Hypsizygus marmoreus]